MKSLLAECHFRSLFFCLASQNVDFLGQSFFFKTLIFDVAFKFFVVSVDFRFHILVAILYLLN